MTFQALDRFRRKSGRDTPETGFRLPRRTWRKVRQAKAAHPLTTPAQPGARHTDSCAAPWSAQTGERFLSRVRPVSTSRQPGRVVPGRPDEAGA